MGVRSYLAFGRRISSSDIGLNPRIGTLEIWYRGMYYPSMVIEPCEVCERGIGHCSNMVGYDNDPERGKLCIVKCRTCQKTLTFNSTDEEECCEHRYVGEDLYQSEAYYGQHDDPEDL